MSRLWTTVSTLLWIAISVSGQCLNSTQTEKIKNNTEAVTKGIRDGIAVLSTIEAGAKDALATGVGAPIAPLIVALNPITNFVIGLINNGQDKGQSESDLTINCLNDYMANMTAQLDGLDAKMDNMKAQIEDLKTNIAEIKEILELISSAIKDLQDFMSDKFGALELEIDAVVGDAPLTAFHSALRWNGKVAGPLMDLRVNAKTLLHFNFSRYGVDKMTEACVGVKSYEPKKIALDTYFIAGSGCRPSLEGMPDTCMANYYISVVNDTHAAAEYVHNLITRTLVELLFYHFTCIGMVYKRAGRIEIEDKIFKERMMDSWNGSPKIIKEITDRLDNVSLSNI